MTRKVILKMISTLIILVALSVPSFEQQADDVPISPCPDVFQYEPLRPPEENAGPEIRWYGVITLRTDVTLNSLVMNIVLDRKASILGNWLGEVTSTDNINFRIENTTLEINPGDAATIPIFVQHNPLTTAPRIRAIRLNGREICNVNKPSSSVQFSQPTPYSTIPSSPAPTNPSRFTEQIQCGKVTLKTPLPLILNGVPTSEGQWPWQIALYHNRGANNLYVCGGTLVSRQHVITAAHCVTKRSSGTKVNHLTLSVHLGKHNLRTSVVGTQTRFVSDIIVHPDYNKDYIFSRDIAILVLQEVVMYTDWVRPACLWPETHIDIQNVVGRIGSVVGWGIDATGAATDNLNLAEMPVVDEITCVRSNRPFFSQFEFEYTYCAGYRNGTSVCLGDSGGGMMFNSAGTWYLRGLVSLSVAGNQKYRCDPTHYTVFTDIAKFLPWIKQSVNI